MTSEEFSRFFLNKRCFWKVQRLLWRSIFSWKSFRLTMPKPHRSLFFFLAEDTHSGLFAGHPDIANCADQLLC